MMAACNLSISLDGSLAEKLQSYCAERSLSPQDFFISLARSVLEPAADKPVEPYFYPQSFDTCRCRGLTPADLDANLVRWAADTALTHKLLPDSLYKTDDLKAKLNALGVALKDGGLTNAAAILFAAAEISSLPQCVLRLSCFAGTDKSVLTAQRQLRGNLFFLLDAGLNFCRDYLPLKNSQASRTEEALCLPLTAVKEALVNALCFRDYSDPSGSAVLSIFADRTVILNRGPLPPSLSLALMQGEHPSAPRNPLVAEVLYKCRLMESLGRGIDGMSRHCRMSSLNPPELENSGGWFKLTFRYPLRGQQDALPPSEDASRQVSALIVCLGRDTLSVKMMMERLGLKGHDNFVRAYLQPALRGGFAEMTYPDAPRHPQQRYRLTLKGLSYYELYLNSLQN